MAKRILKSFYGKQARAVLRDGHDFTVFTTQKSAHEAWKNLLESGRIVSVDSPYPPTADEPNSANIGLHGEAQTSGYLWFQWDLPTYTEADYLAGMARVQYGLPDARLDRRGTWEERIEREVKNQEQDKTLAYYRMKGW